jgi:hypothetical protein
MPATVDVPGVGTAGPGQLINVQFVNNKRFNDWPVGNNAQLNLPPGVWMTYGDVHAT